MKPISCGHLPKEELKQPRIKRNKPGNKLIVLFNPRIHFIARNGTIKEAPIEVLIYIYISQ